jgi:MATE family multidrug resistance protein
MEDQKPTGGACNDEEHDQRESMPLASMESSPEDADRPSPLVMRDFVMLLKDTVPVSLNMVVFFITQACTLAFVGHRLGSTLQAAFSIALSVFNVTGMSLAIGFVSSLDTLCSQAYGRDPTGKSLVPIMHRGIWLALLLCVPIILLFLGSESLLVAAFGAELGEPAAVFLRAMPVYLISNTIGYGIQRGLQAHQAAHLSLGSSVVALVACPFANYYLTTGSTAGAALAATVTNIVGTSATAVLAALHPTSKIGAWPGVGRGWRGYVSEVFPNREVMFDVLRIGFPALAACCAEWWAFEFMLLNVSQYGAITADTFSIAMNITIILIATPAGCASAASARLGNALGANRPIEASMWRRLSLVVNCGVAVVDGLFIVLAGSNLARVFTSDDDVLLCFKGAVPMLALMHGLDCVQTSCQNVFRGAGEQHTAARISLVALWIVGLPISVTLTHFASPSLRLPAALLGFSIGLLVIAGWLHKHSASWDWHAKAIKASSFEDSNDCPA